MKTLFEEVCEENVSETSLKKWCGDLAVTQCAGCTKHLCGFCSHLCKTCRDHCRHHAYCKDCINTHKCPGEIQAA